jgi:hypothetical protein
VSKYSIGNTDVAVDGDLLPYTGLEKGIISNECLSSLSCRLHNETRADLLPYMWTCCLGDVGDCHKSASAQPD